MNNNLKKIRNLNHKTQQEVADYLNSSPQYIAQMENGVRKISNKFAQKLADYFNVSVDNLLGAETIKTAKKVSTSLKNLVQFFKNKGIKYDDYRGCAEDTYDFYMDKELLLILDLLSNPFLDNDGFNLLKSICEMLIERNTNPSLVNFNQRLGKIDNNEETIFNRNKIIVDTFNFKVDKIIDSLKYFKIGDNE